jgi:hypothetical protein
MSRVNLNSEQILKYSVYDKDFLYWNVGFEGLYSFLKKNSDDITEKQRIIFFRNGFVELEPSEETRQKFSFGERFILKIKNSKLIKFGKDIWNRISPKIKNIICEKWCEYRGYLKSIELPIAFPITLDQTEHLIDAIGILWDSGGGEIFTSSINSGEITLPLTIGLGMVLAGLFFKLNKDFDKMCKCKSKQTSKKLNDQIQEVTKDIKQQENELLKSKNKRKKLVKQSKKKMNKKNGISNI